MMNKTILEICLSPDLGGLELYMNKCAKALESDFTVFKLFAKNSKLQEYCQEDKNTLVLQRKSSFSLITVFKLAQIIDHNKIDIVHLHWTKDIPMAVLAKLFSKRKPKLVQTRHMTMTRFKRDIYHKFLYKNIDIIIAVTKAVEKQLITFIPTSIRPRIEQIYLGAQCPSLYSTEDILQYKQELRLEKSFMIGFVGRINEFKGQYLLIEAMKVLKQKNMDIKAFFVGHAMKAEYLQSLKQKVKEYGLQEYVSFLGFTEEPYKFMQACDCMVMASKNETFGLVTIESMQMETVVIGANAGGVLEIIDDNKTGLLFESGNSDDLALKIEQLYKDESLKEKLAQAGKEKTEKYFANERQFNKLNKFLKEV